MAEPTSMTPGTPQVVSLSTSNAQSAAIGAANIGQPTGYTTVRVCATVEVWLAIGTNPTAVAASAGSFLLPAAAVEYLDVPFGSKIAGILASGTGSLSVTPMTKG